MNRKIEMFKYKQKCNVTFGIFEWKIRKKKMPIIWKLQNKSWLFLFVLFHLSIRKIKWKEVALTEILSSSNQQLLLFPLLNDVANRR